MDIRDSLRIAQRYWALFLLLSVAGVSTGALVAIVQTPTYTSTAKAFVAIRSTGSVTDLTQGSIYTQQIVSSYTDAATTPYVLDSVIQSLSLHVTAQQLAETVSASAPPDTAIINITARSTSAAEAARIANAVNSKLADAVDRLSTAGGTVAPVRLTTLQVATPARKPSSPQPVLDVALGLVGGLAVAGLIAFLRETLGSRLRGAHDVEDLLGTPAIGAIPTDRRAPSGEPFLADDTHNGTTTDAFRRLSTNVEHGAGALPRRSWLVTSSVHGEGSTTTAVNMALAMAQSGAQIVAVDTDLAGAGLTRLSGLDGAPGLTDVLAGQAELHDAIHLVDSGLAVLPIGRLAGAIPPGLLGSTSARDALAELHRRFDGVVLDAPPLLASPDAGVLAAHAGGVVVVAAARRVTRAQLQAAIAALGQSGGRLAGVVVTRLPGRGPDSLPRARTTRTGRGRASQPLLTTAAPVRVPADV